MIGTIIGMVGGIAQSIQAQNSWETSMAYSKENAAISQQKFDFNNEQLLQSQYNLQRLEAVFGPIRQNLSNYYANLNPETYQVRMNESIGISYDNAMKQMDAEMARRGITGSGVQASAIADISNQKARLMSQTGQQSQDFVAQQQIGWLQQGEAMKAPYLQQQANSINGVNGSFDTMMSVNSDIANRFSQQAQIEGQSANGFMDMGMYMYGRSQYPTPTITVAPSTGVASETNH